MRNFAEVVNLLHGTLHIPCSQQQLQIPTGSFNENHAQELVYLDCKSLADAIHIVNRSPYRTKNHQITVIGMKRGGGRGGLPAPREVVQVSCWQQVYVLDEGT